MNWIKNISITLAAFLFMLLILEIATRFIWGHPLEKNSYLQRVMLFESGDNFINIDNWFKYFPNKSIRSSTYYVNKGGDIAIKEYDSIIRTNNLGLVQKKNIDIGDNVDIFMGDSFTEGQGAKPWFYEFEEKYKKANKVVNGGILGTGPLQWELLANHLQSEYSIKYNKVNVVLISPDVTRAVWNFNNDMLDCLRNQKCISSQSEFYGYDFHGKNKQDIEKDVIKFHYQQKQELDFNFKSLIKKSAFLSSLYYKIVDKTNINLVAIKNLVNRGKYKGRVYLIPTKSEVREGSMPVLSVLSNKVILWLENNNIDVVFCSSLLSRDFHVNDRHPNAKGYVKIRKCVENL